MRGHRPAQMEGGNPLPPRRERIRALHQLHPNVTLQIPGCFVGTNCTRQVSLPR